MHEISSDFTRHLTARLCPERVRAWGGRYAWQKGGAISLATQFDSKHLAALCNTIQALTEVAPKALVTLENPWNGHFKEHRMIQELIENHRFWLY